jgi:hypothetical protein
MGQRRTGRSCSAALLARRTFAIVISPIGAGGSCQ